MLFLVLTLVQRYPGSDRAAVRGEACQGRAMAVNLLWRVLFFQNLSLSRHLGVKEVQVVYWELRGVSCSSPNPQRAVQTDQRDRSCCRLHPAVAGLGWAPCKPSVLCTLLTSLQAIPVYAYGPSC